MTFGPIEPSMTGNSIDLPLALSVNVIVPAGTMTLGVLPSIDAPQCFARRRLPDLAENRLPGADYQTPFGFCNAISHVRKQRPHVPPTAASAIRARVSSRPSTSMTSKIPGEATEPVRAARSG